MRCVTSLKHVRDMLRHSVNHMVFLGLRLEMWNIERANRIERRDERVIQLAAAAGGAQLLPHLSQRPQHPCRSNRCPWQCSQSSSSTTCYDRMSVRAVGAAGPTYTRHLNSVWIGAGAAVKQRALSIAEDWAPTGSPS